MNSIIEKRVTTSHALSFERKGTGMGGSIKPLCTCGWHGSEHYAHNDYQHSNAREQFAAHVDAMMKERAK